MKLLNPTAISTSAEVAYEAEMYEWKSDCTVAFKVFQPPDKRCEHHAALHPSAVVGKWRLLSPHLVHG
jgi:hypothetical protein